MRLYCHRRTSERRQIQRGYVYRVIAADDTSWDCDLVDADDNVLKTVDGITAADLHAVQKRVAEKAWRAEFDAWYAHA